MTNFNIYMGILIMMCLFLVSLCVLFWAITLKIFGLIPLSWWSFYWSITAGALLFAILFLLREFNLIPHAKFKLDTLKDYTPPTTCEKCQKDTKQ